jgi:histidinol-phosphatase (PHP family)
MGKEKLSMFEDYHVHSYHSDDSSYPMEQVVLDAIEMGMDEICFTDHVDYGIKKDYIDCTPEQIACAVKNGDSPAQKDAIILNPDYPVYFAELEALKQKYAGKIAIKKGLEFGMQTHTIPAYQKLFDCYANQLDFILLSIHQVDDLEFWTQDYQRNKSQDAYIQGYYNQLLDLVQNYKDYSVLAHLDLIARYDKIGNYPFEKIEPVVTQILKQVIQDGKGIEINTSSVRYQVGDLTPSKDILRLYKELGGKIITFGSDSHTPNHLGKYIQEQKQQLKELGFKEYCTFEKMSPFFHIM